MWDSSCGENNPFGKGNPGDGCKSFIYRLLCMCFWPEYYNFLKINPASVPARLR